MGEIRLPGCGDAVFFVSGYVFALACPGWGGWNCDLVLTDQDLFGLGLRSYLDRPGFRPGGRLTFLLCDKKVSKETHPPRRPCGVPSLRTLSAAHKGRGKPSPGFRVVLIFVCVVQVLGCYFAS